MNAQQALIDLQFGAEDCTKLPACESMRDRFTKRMLGRYVADPVNGMNASLVSAVIDLTRFKSADEYFSSARKVHKGNAVREAKKSDQQGFVCHQFVWRNHIPDVVEINTSKDIRSGGAMRDAYKRTIADLGGPPTELHALKPPACPIHHTYCWGIFEKQSGYRQGTVVTGEKLLAYIKFKRNGSIGIYTSLLGHGEYLHFGIIYRLHYAIISWLCDEKPGSMKGLRHVLYGSFDSGNDGLKQWKKRALFEPVSLALGDSSFCFESS